MIRILTAWYLMLTNRNEGLVTTRLKICAKCDKRKWFVCNVCKCPLNVKARLLDESCPYPGLDKWKSLENHP